MLRKLRGGLGGAHRFAEFLPDAEGVVERGHSPVAGLLILTIAAAFGGLLGWAALTEIEQVVQANGEVEPAGRVKIVNHPDGGRVAEVHVVEGQRVEPGEPLVTFDPELIQTQLAELTGRLEVKGAEVARLSAEAEGGELSADQELAAARPGLIEEQRALLETRRQAYASRIEGVTQEVAQRRNELASIAAELARLRQSHALLGVQLDAVRGLAEKGLYPRLRLATLEGQLNDLAGDIRKTQAQQEAAKAALAEAQSRLDGVAREWRSSVLADLGAARAERDRLAEAQKRQAATLRNLVVRAPVAGIVQDLGVTTSGQSIGSNQPLMKLVPTGGGLVIEARIANRDIGHIRLGQPAKVKVQAYDFLRYGTLAGTVERIAADATVDPKTGALTYGLTVRTDGAEIGRGDGPVQRAAGHGGRGRPPGRRADHPLLPHRPDLPAQGDGAAGGLGAGRGCWTAPRLGPPISITLSWSLSLATTKLRWAKPWQERTPPQRISTRPVAVAAVAESVAVIVADLDLQPTRVRLGHPAVGHAVEQRVRAEVGVLLDRVELVVLLDREQQSRLAVQRPGRVVAWVAAGNEAKDQQGKPAPASAHRTPAPAAARSSLAESSVTTRCRCRSCRS